MSHKIAIAGAGGIGSNLLAILFDYGFNRKQFNYHEYTIDIFDDDMVDLKNLLHQNFTTDDIGKYKVHVLEDKYVVNGIARRMNEDLFKSYDYIFCCVDNMPFRKALYEYSWQNKGQLFWVDGRCASRQGAVFNSDIDKQKLSPWIDDSTEEGGCLYSYEKENNQSHVLPLIVAGMMVQTFLNKLRGVNTSMHSFMV